MSEQDDQTTAQPEVLTRVDSGEGTLQRSIPGVAEHVLMDLGAVTALAPVVKGAVEGVVQKVKDHNAPEVIPLPESESWGSE